MTKRHDVVLPLSLHVEVNGSAAWIIGGGLDGPLRNLPQGGVAPAKPALGPLLVMGV